jgi:transcription elongation factor Elf1
MAEVLEIGVERECPMCGAPPKDLETAADLGEGRRHVHCNNCGRNFCVSPEGGFEEA